MNAGPAEIQRALRGADYPATRSDLINHAEENGAPEDVIRDLESLDDEEFASPAGVMAALGEGDDLEDLEDDDGYEDEE